MTLQELVTRYSFEIDDKPLQKVNERLDATVKFATKVGVVVGGAAATLFAFAKTAANAGDNALKAAQKVGIGVERFQELAFAARGANVEAGSFNSSLRFLTRNMVEAHQGNKEAIKSFARMGVSVRGAGGQLLSTDQVLLQIADRFQKMPDGPQKTAMAMDLLGKSGADLIPLLNDGSQGIEQMTARAHELGVVMSEEDAVAAKEFNDAMMEQMAALEGVRNVVGVKLFRAFTPLVKKFTQWIVVHRKMIAQRIERLFAILSKLIERTVTIMDTLIDSALGLTRVFGGLENVLTALGVGFAIFTAGRLLYGIGQVTVAIAGMAKMLTLANVSAMAIPLLIGAAIVSLGLLIEDFVAYFQGRDSVTGTVMKWFDGLGRWVQALVGAVPLLNQVLAVMKLVTMIGDGAAKAWDFIVKRFGQWGEGRAAVMNAPAPDLGLLGSGIAQAAQTPAMTPASAPALGTGGGGGISTSLNLRQEINVGSGDPTEVGRKVEQGTETAFDKTLRGTIRAFGR